MNTVELLTFTFGGAGLTVILVASSLLEPVRKFVTGKSPYLGELISCTMCTGFWAGFASSWFYDINPLWAGSMVSLFSWSIHSIVSAFNSADIYFDAAIDDGDEE